MSPVRNGVFVSYRREDGRHMPGRLSDRLIDRYRRERVFIDVEAFAPPEADFAETVSRALSACAVLLAVIGPGWLRAADERGGRRLDDPRDLVRLEIGTALEQDLPVIPVLLDGAAMPAPGELPGRLRGLAGRDPLTLRSGSFRADAGRVLAAVEDALASAPGPAAKPRVIAVRGRLGRGTPENPEDLARVLELADEAERLALTLPDAERANLLSELAQAVAVVQPAQAARLDREARRIVGAARPQYGHPPETCMAPPALGLADVDKAGRKADAPDAYTQAKVCCLYIRSLTSI